MTSETDDELEVTHSYDPTTERASLAVVEAVAAVTDSDVTSLPPLQHAVETDSLDALADNEAVEVAFEYENCRVSVSRGTVDVRPSSGFE